AGGKARARTRPVTSAGPGEPKRLRCRAQWATTSAPYAPATAATATPSARQPKKYVATPRTGTTAVMKTARMAWRVNGACTYGAGPMMRVGPWVATPSWAAVVVWVLTGPPPPWAGWPAPPPAGGGSHTGPAGSTGRGADPWGRHRSTPRSCCRATPPRPRPHPTACAPHTAPGRWGRGVPGRRRCTRRLHQRAQGHPQGNPVVPRSGHPVAGHSDHPVGEGLPVPEGPPQRMHGGHVENREADGGRILPHRQVDASQGGQEVPFQPLRVAVGQDLDGDGIPLGQALAEGAHQGPVGHRQGNDRLGGADGSDGSPEAEEHRLPLVVE